MVFLRLNGITRVDRLAMTCRLRQAITDSGGFITDFRQFSNKSICLNFEIESSHVARLHAALLATDLQLSAETEESLESLEGEQGAEVAGTLQATFVHDEPDLRIPVPAVPG